MVLLAAAVAVLEQVALLQLIEAVEQAFSVINLVHAVVREAPVVAPALLAVKLVLRLIAALEQMVLATQIVRQVDPG